MLMHSSMHVMEAYSETSKQGPASVLIFVLDCPNREVSWFPHFRGLNYWGKIYRVLNIEAFHLVSFIRGSTVDLDDMEAYSVRCSSWEARIVSQKHSFWIQAMIISILYQCDVEDC